MECVTVGADPEVFLSNGTSIVSAIGHVGGSKEYPIPVTKGALQEDNVLAEFNIDPADNSEDFIDNIGSVLSSLEDKVHPLTVDIRSHHFFERSVLQRSGRKALMFGCDPDYNAYTGKRNMAPSALTELRTAGGHVHVGYENPTEESNRKIIKLMDLYLGIPSVLIEGENPRRSLYGKAGAYRNKPYGVEYRSLSNFWIASSYLMEWVFRQSVAAVRDHNDVEFFEGAVQMAINNSDPVMARKIVDQYSIPMP